MNGNDPFSLQVPLRFLGPGAWSLRSFADGPEAKRNPNQVLVKQQVVTSDSLLQIDLAPAGGFAAVVRGSKVVPDS